jgi:hypothetical protein
VLGVNSSNRCERLLVLAGILPMAGPAAKAVSRNASKAQRGAACGLCGVDCAGAEKKMGKGKWQTDCLRHFFSNIFFSAFSSFASLRETLSTRQSRGHETPFSRVGDFFAVRRDAPYLRRIALLA